jgi:pyridoxamine 5'-phosphate oxidase
MEIGPNSQPLTVFSKWMEEAKADTRIREASAMAVATVSSAGEVHNRIVLCKSWSDDGFVFYTNYESQKGEDLAARPVAGAVFYWDPLFRQIKISGAIEKTSRAESEAYWRSRARGSQLSQFISSQSRPVDSRAELEQASAAAEKRFQDAEIPCPPHWGGYRLRPKAIEFWIGQPNRLHDRHEFLRRPDSTWTYRRLYP